MYKNKWDIVKNFEDLNFKQLVKLMFVRIKVMQKFNSFWKKKWEEWGAISTPLVWLEDRKLLPILK